MDYNGKQVKGVKRQERHQARKHGMVVSNRGIFVVQQVIGKKAKQTKKGGK